MVIVETLENVTDYTYLSPARIALSSSERHTIAKQSHYDVHGAMSGFHQVTSEDIATMAYKFLIQLELDMSIFFLL